VPGTQVSLGAWDIIGIFSGVPLAMWILVGLITRSGRARRFEEMLEQATSRQDLYHAAVRYENALMWRMIGPHQALRLERMRTELEREKFADDAAPVYVPAVQGIPGADKISAKVTPVIEALEGTTPNHDEEALDVQIDNAPVRTEIPNANQIDGAPLDERDATSQG